MILISNFHGKSGLEKMVKNHFSTFGLTWTGVGLRLVCNFLQTTISPLSNHIEPNAEKWTAPQKFHSSLQKKIFISRSRNGKAPFHISMQKTKKMEVNLHEPRTIHAPRESLHRIAERHLSLREKDTRITPEAESVRHYFRGMKYGTRA